MTNRMTQKNMDNLKEETLRQIKYYFKDCKLLLAEEEQNCRDLEEATGLQILREWAFPAQEKQ